MCKRKQALYFSVLTDKKTPNKRKRGSLSLEASPLTNPKTPSGGSRSVPLSERQQLAMIMRMSDETSQGEDCSRKGTSINNNKDSLTSNL